MNWCEFDLRVEQLGHQLFYGKFVDFYGGIDFKIREKISKITTRNILGLRIVMKEKYGKIWDKTKWIKQ